MEITMVGKVVLEIWIKNLRNKGIVNLKMADNKP